MIPRGAAVLDVGAGDGTNAAQMLALGCKVSALEPVLEGGGKDEQRLLLSQGDPRFMYTPMPWRELQQQGSPDQAAI